MVSPDRTGVDVVCLGWQGLSHTPFFPFIFFVLINLTYNHLACAYTIFSPQINFVSTWLDIFI
jgi:hypothetical protein